MEGIGAPTSVPGTAAPAGGGLGALDGNAFLQLMVAQMKYQNPFEPMDTSQMLQQTASLTTVETLQQVAAGQRALMGIQQATVASSLMGQEVKALSLDGGELAGVVEKVNFTADGPVLTIEGEEVPIGNVIELRPKAAAS